MKQKLLIGTDNEGKFREFSNLLAGQFDCVKPPNKIQVVEDGSTYYENALKKTVAYAGAFKMPVLTDDSGLEVGALDGAPGIYSARFGGEDRSWEDRWRLLFQKLEALSATDWSAQFRCVLCYYDPKGVPEFFEGTVEGQIIAEPRGKNGFGYDPIFLCPELKKTFAEASNQEKAKVSHRARAIQKFLAGLD